MDVHFSVLIIEDDPAMARSLKEALSSEHFIPDWAATGSEGLQRALTHTPTPDHPGCTPSGWLRF